MVKSADLEFLLTEPLYSVSLGFQTITPPTRPRLSGDRDLYPGGGGAEAKTKSLCT